MSAYTENLQFSREDLDFGELVHLLLLLEFPYLKSMAEIPENLPEKLGEELRRLEQLFTIDTALLKTITDRFGEELQAGEHLHLLSYSSSLLLALG
jgi:hypothetical protein